MDTKKETLVKAAIAVAILVVIWFIFRNRPQEVLGPGPTLNSFQAPYFQTNPGIQDSTTTGQFPPFTSTNTINVQTGQIAGLSRSFIPLFGLVGMTAVQG